MNKLQELSKLFDKKYPEMEYSNVATTGTEVMMREREKRSRESHKKFFLDSCVDYANAYLFIKNVDISAGECILEIRGCIKKDIKTLKQ